MTWLQEFASRAEETDQLVGRDNYLELLAAGLVGEAGSVVAEVKKEHREGQAYGAADGRLLEELGDFLWYFVRLGTVVAPGALASLRDGQDLARPGDGLLSECLKFSACVGALVVKLSADERRDTEVEMCVRSLWDATRFVASAADLRLSEIAAENTAKAESRWPTEKLHLEPFDIGFPEEEQLPRTLRVEFRQREVRGRPEVLLRCNNLNFGDRLTDSIADPDFYRYHDVFHFANAVHLAWSPVTRALLHCKRKSCQDVDEAEDGARAGIIEEAISAVVYGRAKDRDFFSDLTFLEYDLLKMVRDFAAGYEVDAVPLWQWEAAILDGFRVFRLLRENAGGIVELDLNKRRLNFTAH